MKKLTALILILVLVIPCAACTDGREFLLDHYSLFINGNFYNTFYNGTFAFDSLTYDIFFLDDFSGCYLLKNEWADGKLTSSGLTKLKYKKAADGFELVFDDGTSYPGKWDQLTDDMWLDLNGHYFRFTPTHSFDVQNDLDGQG